MEDHVLKVDDSVGKIIQTFESNSCEKDAELSVCTNSPVIVSSVSTSTSSSISITPSHIPPSAQFQTEKRKGGNREKYLVESAIDEFQYHYVDWDDIDIRNRKLYGAVVPVAPAHFSRLLYANPVCLLTTVSGESSTPTSKPIPDMNVMTISWLTPTTNNDGGFIMSMNATRYSATLLKKSKRFVLSIPILGMENLVRDIGKCSGFDHTHNNSVIAATEVHAKLEAEVNPSVNTTITPTADVPAPGKGRVKGGREKGIKKHTLPVKGENKFQRLSIPICRPGWRSFPQTQKTSVGCVEGVEGIGVGEEEMRKIANIDDSIKMTDQANDTQSDTQSQSQAQAQAQTQDSIQSSQSANKKRRAPPVGYTAKKKKAQDILHELKTVLDVSDEYSDVAIQNCIAHMICEVQYIVDPPIESETGQTTTGETVVGITKQLTGLGTPQHLTIFAQIKAGFVREKYWSNGNFCPIDVTTPPYLTFFGGGSFGYCATRQQLRETVQPFTDSDTITSTSTSTSTTPPGDRS